MGICYSGCSDVPYYLPGLAYLSCAESHYNKCFPAINFPASPLVAGSGGVFQESDFLFMVPDLIPGYPGINRYTKSRSEMAVVCPFECVGVCSYVDNQSGCREWAGIHIFRFLVISI